MNIDDLNYDRCCLRKERDEARNELKAIKRTLWLARAEKYKERMMRFGLLAYHYACEGDSKDSNKTKCTRISELCEAMERKCREYAERFK